VVDLTYDDSIAVLDMYIRDLEMLVFRLRITSRKHTAVQR
jgi:hypothetical protein